MKCLLTFLCLVVTVFSKSFTIDDYPEPEIQIGYGQGLKITIPPKEGVKILSFHVYKNEEKGDFNPFRMPLGRGKSSWRYEDKRIKLRNGDVIHMWVNFSKGGQVVLFEMLATVQKNPINVPHKNHVLTKRHAVTEDDSSEEDDYDDSKYRQFPGGTHFGRRTNSHFSPFPGFGHRFHPGYFHGFHPTTLVKKTYHGNAFHHGHGYYNHFNGHFGPGNGHGHGFNKFYPHNSDEHKDYEGHYDDDEDDDYENDSPEGTSPPIFNKVPSRRPQAPPPTVVPLPTEGNTDPLIDIRFGR